MICVSISQDSRRMALADMLNAASLGADLLEVRLDAFDKSPEIGELIAHKPRPLVFSCRRFQDGGCWQGPESERLALLRQCIISKADYVEIELDAADQIRRFPPSKRVIAYTNLTETPADIADIYEACLSKSPDVVKLATLARTPEEAWPLLQIVAKQRVPTVVVGLGKSGIMLSILGKKIGAPWVYAALEQGMEAYPGQVTVSDLRNTYRYDDVNPKTKLVGITGFGPLQSATAAALNTAIASLDLPARCLPIGVGSIGLFRKIIDAVKLAAVVVDPAHMEALFPLADQHDSAAAAAKAVDLLVHKENGWFGSFTLYRAALQALESKLRQHGGPDHPLRGRMVMVVGTNALARAMIGALNRRGALPIVAGRDKSALQAIAQEYSCRQALFEAIYSTMHDMVIVCAEEAGALHTPSASSGRGGGTAGAAGEPGLHAGYLKSSMAVMDLTHLPTRTPFLREASFRTKLVVEPRDILVHQWAVQARLLSGKEVSPEVLAAAVPAEETDGG